MSDDLRTRVAKALLSAEADLFGLHNGRWEFAGERYQTELLAYADAAIREVFTALQETSEEMLEVGASAPGEDVFKINERWRCMLAVAAKECSVQL